MAYSLQHIDRLRLRHLRLLALIDQYGSLRGVGNILNLTQPAVSQMVKDLEYAFGTELVTRSVRGVALTEAGRLALQRARSGLATFDHLVKELQTDQPMILRVGTNPALTFQLIPDALRQLHLGGKQVRFRFLTGIVSDMMQALWDGELDCYVGRVDWDRLPHQMASALRHVPLARTDLVLACSTSHPLAGRGPVSVDELVKWPWVLPDDESNNRVALEAGLRNHGIAAPQPIAEIAADPNALMIFARQLEALTCVPQMALARQIEVGEMWALDVPDLVLPPIQIGFVTLAEHVDMPPLVALREALILGVTTS